VAQIADTIRGSAGGKEIPKGSHVVGLDIGIPYPWVAVRPLTTVVCACACACVCVCARFHTYERVCLCARALSYVRTHIQDAIIYFNPNRKIGTGASVIYPLLGASAYGWKFIGSECNEESFVSAQRIVSANAAIRNDIQIDVRFQASSSSILTGVLKEDEMIDFVMCNPPFFESEGDRGLKQNLD
jgi:hypothetical protein